MTRCAVLGAGSWGTTLADLLARQGHDVVIWAYEEEVVSQINAEHVNRLFLPGAELAETLQATGDAPTAVQGAHLVVSASPSHAVRSVLSTVAGRLEPRATIVSATKGLETGTLLRMSEVARALIAEHPFVVLSGPSFATEVFARQPTAVVCASQDEVSARRVQDAFSSTRFRVYSNTDVVGTEVAGALKNVIAIAAGILEGLGLGYNPLAALLTRGLAEISRLGVALGANPLTFMGLAGMGDLVLTATGTLSRNRSLGVALGQGQRLDQYLQSQRTVSEGVNATQAALKLAERVNVEMPITAKVGEILFQNADPQQAIMDLMERSPKPERQP